MTQNNNEIDDVQNNIPLLDFHYHYRIAAHRMILIGVSAYFKALFDTPLKEREQFEYQIPGISGDILERIIDYCYQRTIDIEEDNADALLIAASYLQIPELEARCIQYHKNSLTPSNCLGIWAFAEQYVWKELKRSAEAFIFRNIKDVVKCEEFMHLSSADFEIILKSNYLNFDREEDVFNALIQWIRFDTGKRKDCFGKLFQCIRLQHLERSVSSIFELQATDVFINTQTRVSRLVH